MLILKYPLVLDTHKRNFFFDVFRISFYFKSSKKSNNGTDVNAGQIPQLLYKVITQETKAPPRQIDLSEPVFVLSKEFSSTVTSVSEKI